MVPFRKSLVLLILGLVLVTARPSPPEQTPEDGDPSTLSSTLNPSTPVKSTTSSTSSFGPTSTTFPSAFTNSKSSTESTSSSRSTSNYHSTSATTSTSSTTSEFQSITGLNTSSPPATAQANSSPTTVPQSESQHRPTPAAIAFEVIGAIIGVIFLFSIFRCCNSYRKTPHYDRVAAAINRHLIYREMTERDRAVPESGRSTPILPRYSPRPPTFVSREGSRSSHQNPFNDSNSTQSRPVSGAESASVYSSPFSDEHANEGDGRTSGRPISNSTHSLLSSDTISVYSSASSPFIDPVEPRTLH